MEQIVQLKALSSKVLTVAVVNSSVGDWAAYVDAVQGKDHSKEAEEVWKHGNKLSFQLAKTLYPQVAELYSWRD